MGEASTSLHEAADQLKPQTIDIHRAIVSLMEELEAIDWYQQRADACGDGQLRSILIHNMNEEIEHATMILEWVRRKMPKFDETLKMYLFTTGEITEIEQAAESGEKMAAEMTRSSLRATIGDMKGS